MWRNVISVPCPGLLSVVDPVEVSAIPTIVLIVGLTLSPRWEFLVEQRLHLRRWCVGTSWTDLLPLGLDTYIGSAGVGYEVQCQLGPIRGSPRWASVGQYITALIIIEGRVGRLVLTQLFIPVQAGG